MTLTAEELNKQNQLQRELFNAYLGPNQLLEELEQKRNHLQALVPEHLSRESFVEFLNRFSSQNVAILSDYQKLQAYRQLGGTYP